MMVKTGNGIPNRANVCNEASQEQKKIKNKSAAKIDDVIRKYLITQFNLYDIQTMRPRCSPITREESTPPLPNIRSVKPIPEIPINATA